MARVWRLQEAKSRFGDVVDQSDLAPQIITRRGVATAVVISYAAYRKLILNQAKLTVFLRESPLAEVDLDLARDQSPVRV
jgi:antitoxin Phd